MMWNLASIGLGLLALGLGFAAISRKGNALPVCFSLTACCFSLLGQLVELRYLTVIGDWAAVEDTVGARVFAAVFLLTLTLFLNLIALLRDRK